MGFHTAGLARSCLGRGKAKLPVSATDTHWRRRMRFSVPNPLKPHSLYVLLSVTTTLCQPCRGKCSAQHWWLIRGLQEMPLPSGSLCAWWGVGRVADTGLEFSSCMGRAPCCHTNTLFPFEKTGKK